MDHKRQRWQFTYAIVLTMLVLATWTVSVLGFHRAGTVLGYVTVGLAALWLLSIVAHW